MYQVSNFTENDDVKGFLSWVPFRSLNTSGDLSVSPSSAVTAYFSAIDERQSANWYAICTSPSVTIQAGAMQWMLATGTPPPALGRRGLPGKKVVRGKASGESQIAEYTGDGLLVLEPIP